MISRPALVTLSSMLALALTFLALAADPPVSNAPKDTGSELEIELEALQSSLDGCFATSTTCALCHSGSERARAMRDETGQSIAQHDLWRSTMMANSARDPLWRAMVSAEVAGTPSRKAEIEATCTRCHSPMASVEKGHAEETLTLAELYDGEARHNQLALDGVSCTACHQIAAEGLGEPESFGGNFTIAEGLLAHGPHANTFAMPMIRHTGFTPRQGDQMLSSELCATCHTLTTTPFDADGTPVEATFLEQAPYLEWKNSVFARGEDPTTCQDCHAPKSSEAGIEIETGIARNPMGGDFGPVAPRSPFGRHIFVGGNTLTPRLLAANQEALQPAAPSEAFEATVDRARQQLQTRAAKVAIDSVHLSDEAIEVTVALVNLSGHKFPSAHPIRRAWLQLVVTGPEGQTIFESGAFDDHDRIVDQRGIPLPSELAGGPVQPHYELIDSSDQVQIYNSTMSDRLGNTTHSLLRAAGYSKDNRLLPLGWSADGPWAEDTAPVGTDDDADFQAGGDRLVYRIARPDLATTDSIVITARLLYQTLSTRHAAELFEFDTAEIRDLKKMLETTRASPEIIDEVRLEHRLQPLTGT